MAKFKRLVVEISNEQFIALTKFQKTNGCKTVAEAVRKALPLAFNKLNDTTPAAAVQRN
jgi:ribosomal protein L18